MKKLITFSLWGQTPKYTEGAIANAKIAQSLFSDWLCRFYIADSVPKKTVETLTSMDNVELVHMDSNIKLSFLDRIRFYVRGMDLEKHKSDLMQEWMVWRFYAASEPDVAIVLSRDADSRLSRRERAMVQEFEDSGFLFHDIKDHPSHFKRKGFCGGMWGVKGDVIDDVQGLFQEFKVGYTKSIGRGIDESFMELIYTNFCTSENTLKHYLSCPHTRSRYPLNDLNDFIGAIREEDGTPFRATKHRRLIEEFIRDNK